MGLMVEIEDHEEAEFLADLLKVPLRSAKDRDNRYAMKMFDGMIKKLTTKVTPRLNEEEVLLCQTVLQAMRNRIEEIGPKEKALLDSITMSLQPKNKLAS